jgi:hypothetical protein
VALAYSRPAAVATRLIRDAAAGQLLARPVLLVADRFAIETPAGRSMFLAALSLLTRFCAELTVLRPTAAKFAARAQDLATRIHHAGTISFIKPEVVRWESYSAILNVGNTFRADLPWTTIASDGWAIQVCSTRGPVELRFVRFNPAATLAAASLGSSEVFKRLLGVVPPLGELFGNEVFSLLTYTSDADPGPKIAGPLRLDCVLAGHGAIGNGVRHVLLELPLEGWLAILDNQKAGEENWGTYIDLDRDGFGHSKAELAALGWGSGVIAVPFDIDVAEAKNLVGRNIPHPHIVLGALDNIEARHAVQQLWPDLAIDGAIGDVTCQVSIHPWGRDTACLQCLFRQPAGEDSAVVSARLTGLSVESARRLDDVVTQADIDGAPPERRAWLVERRGKPRCSVIREAMAAQLTGGAASFSPSAPFVASLSGAMVAGEFIKTRMGLATPLDPRFQFNLLRGPGSGTLLDQARRPACFCSERAAAVDRWRAAVKPLPLKLPKRLPRCRSDR